LCNMTKLSMEGDKAKYKNWAKDETNCLNDSYKSSTIFASVGVNCLLFCIPLEI